MAVLAGYVILLSVNRQLSSRLRAERHQAQVQATTALFQDLQPQSLQPPEVLQRRLSELASLSILVWLEPVRATAGPAILPSGSVFQQWHPGHALIKAAEAERPADGSPTEFRWNGRVYFTCAEPLQLGGQPYRLHFLQDFTLEAEQERLLSLLLIAVAGASALVTSALLRLVIHRGLLPLDSFSKTLAGISTGSLTTARIALTGQPSELHPIATAFNDLLDRLSDAWEHQRTFVNGVSHELRTPITLISGYSRRLLRRSEALSEEQQQQLQLVATESESMGRLVNDLLEIARDDSGRLQLDCQQMDPALLLADVYQRLEPSSQGRLQLEPASEGAVEVSADPERLSQCLSNLVENALKYSPPAEPVTMLLSHNADEVVLHVRDHGAGVPQEERDAIFGRFVRGQGSSEVSGHGIGLAVVKTLMERMGGQVQVADAPGGGADFQLRFPASTASASQERQSRSTNMRRWFTPGA